MLPLDRCYDSQIKLPSSMPLGICLRGRHAFITLSTLAMCVFLGAFCRAQSGNPADLVRIEAGTPVENNSSARWNSIVMLARPRIASGDVNALPRSIQDTVSSFVLSILATIESEVDPATGQPKYRLREVGAGYAMDVDGQLQVVTLQDYSSMGLRLGLIQRQMLLENEKQLATAKIVARTSTLTMFDTPALVHKIDRSGKSIHQDFVMRHFVWIDSRTGKSATLVWLMTKDSLNEWQVVDEPMHLLPAGTKEDRRIHVDGDEFLFGIPSERAFALEDLPLGAKIAWTTEAKQLASMQRYDMESLRALTESLSAAIQSTRRTAASEPTESSDQR